jgi:hypothetical protein
LPVYIACLDEITVLLVKEKNMKGANKIAWILESTLRCLVFLIFGT